MCKEIIEARDRKDKLGDDFVGFHPAELLSAVKRDLQRADADRERREAKPVETQIEILPGLVHEYDEAEYGEDAERQVDKEHPVPRIGLGQPGAERGSHDWTHHYAHAPDRHRLGAFVQ